MLLNYQSLFIPQSFHNLSSADVPGREGDADGDDHEEEEEDDEGDDEEVRPELVDPVGREVVTPTQITAVEEERPRDIELEPNDVTKEGGEQGEDGTFAKKGAEDATLGGSEGSHDADVFLALADLEPEGTECAQHDVDGKESERQGGELAHHARLRTFHCFLQMLLVGFQERQDAETSRELLMQRGGEPSHERLGIHLGLQT